MSREQYNVISVEERFWLKVNVRNVDECWNWTASKQNAGYGNFNVGDGQMSLSHRYSWELHHNKTIPAGMQVCHSCDNIICCNPKHLFLAKTNAPKGIKHYNCRLTEEEMSFIKNYPKGYGTGTFLAKKFKMTR